MFSLPLLGQPEGLTWCCFFWRRLVHKYAPLNGNITGSHCYWERGKGPALFQGKVVPVNVNRNRGNASGKSGLPKTPCNQPFWHGSLCSGWKWLFSEVHPHKGMMGVCSLQLWEENSCGVCIFNPHVFAERFIHLRQYFSLWIFFPCFRWALYLILSWLFWMMDVI